LPPAEENEPAGPKFSEAQIAYVQSWIRQKAPECTPEASGAVAQQFLEELQQRYPEKLDQITSGNFLAGNFESMLLRYVAVKMAGPANAKVREELARRRVVVGLVGSGRDGSAALTEAPGLLEKIQDGSQSQYRRLVDGRMDDDDLQLLLKKTSQAGVVKKEPKPATPKVLTAADIVAEFSRRNQVGTALQHLQAYVVEGRITTAAGEHQELLLFRMRPDSFRLVVRSGGVTRYILAGSSGRYWQHVPAKPPQTVPAQALGDRRYLSEFVDPLFDGDDFAFERLEDGAVDGKKFYRVIVRRSDHSNYVARIDHETFREVGRENEDHSVALYSDFREIAGVTYAFREEITDGAGRKGVLELTRVSANPGLIRNLFEPPARPELGYYELESYLAAPSVTVGKSN
jgi:hypothetical protein